MSLTLNIIERELEPYGTTVRRGEDNPLVDDIRLYLGNESLRGANVLYLCETEEDACAIGEAGCMALYVNPADDAPSRSAVLSLLGGQERLVVFNALLDAFYRYQSWFAAMDQVFVSGGSLQDLVSASSGFLRNNVVIVDPALKLLAYTDDVPCDDPITMELIEHGYHTEENIREFKLHKRFKPWTEQEGFVINETREICKYVTVVRSFKTRTSFSLITVMMCNVVPPDGYLLDVYELFAKRVEQFAVRDYPDDKPSGNATDTFLKDLLTGAVASDDVVKGRCGHVGIPYEARFCLFYIDSQEDGVPFSRLVSDVARLVAPAKTVLIDNAVVVLCFNCVNDRCALHCASGSCPLGHKSMSSRLNGMMERYGLICGRSSKFTQLPRAAVAFQQAREAHRLGSRKIAVQDNLRIPHNWNRIFSFDSCCVDYLADSIQGEGTKLAGSTYAGFVIDSMARQDAENKTDNYQFLYTYLMHERRALIVAEKLHMHRNNVKYRIDRIEEQFGIDTDDPMLRFDFLLAYRLREAALVQKAQ